MLLDRSTEITRGAVANPAGKAGRVAHRSLIRGRTMSSLSCRVADPVCDKFQM
jgi:hypothetical protein